MGAKHAALLLALATYATPLSLKAVHREFKVKDASVISKLTYDAARERQPVLIFLSGADVPHEKYAWLAEGLAARGIATCLSSTVASFGPTTCLLSLPYDLARLASEHAYRAAAPSADGLRCLLDDLAALECDALDLSHVTLGGHSTGGRAALDVVAFGCGDAFPKSAAVAYGASFVNGPSSPLAPGTCFDFDASRGAGVPLLLLGGERDGVSAALESRPPETLRRTFDAAKAGAAPVDLVVLRGANHMSCARPPEPACGAPPDLRGAGFDAATFEASFCDLVAAHVLGGDLAAVATDAALHLSTARAVAKDEDIDVDVTLHARFGDYMASKPSVDFDGGPATCRVHAFVEPDWTAFDRPLSTGGDVYTYRREVHAAALAAGPALCLKLKRREAVAGAPAEDAPADGDAAKTVGELALSWALPGVDDCGVVFGDDRELLDNPDGPFGNKGGLYVSSVLCEEDGRIVAPTITTPLEGVPDAFKGHHYMKVLPPPTLRRLVVDRPSDGKKLDADGAWALLEAALDDCIARLTAALDAAPADVADDDAAWRATAGDLEIAGTIAAWTSDTAAWAVRYANAVPGRSQSAGFNVALSAATDAAPRDARRREAAPRASRSTPARTSPPARPTGAASTARTSRANSSRGPASRRRRRRRTRDSSARSPDAATVTCDAADRGDVRARRGPRGVDAWLAGLGAAATPSPSDAASLRARGDADHAPRPRGRRGPRHPRRRRRGACVRDGRTLE
ncbi:hypothetical protein JL722_9191 [Aureococcus anophagefferens]|nr:hypothetical protein JL722_9191 [Aureococcus anophagefferens]